MTPSPTTTIHCVFVCTGNICRSPMAEIMARDAVAHSDTAADITLSSCGLGSWHVGELADRRTRAELATIGLNGEEHRAAVLGPEHRAADIFIALDDGHRRGLIDSGIPAAKIALLRAFDPHYGIDTGAVLGASAQQLAAAAGTDTSAMEVADPYYGTQADFSRCRTEIAAAIPGLLALLVQHAQDKN